MKLRTLAFPFLFILLKAADGSAQAPTAAEVNAVRAQIDALKADYEKRIQALETQLQEIQAQMLQIAPESSAGAAPTTVPTSPGALNPAISVIGNFVGRIDNQKVFNGDGVRIVGGGGDSNGGLAGQFGPLAAGEVGQG